jgi:hypothetical protein
MISKTIGHPMVLAETHEVFENTLRQHNEWLLNQDRYLMDNYIKPQQERHHIILTYGELREIRPIDYRLLSRFWYSGFNDNLE